MVDQIARVPRMLLEWERPGGYVDAVAFPHGTADPSDLYGHSRFQRHPNRA